MTTNYLLGKGEVLAQQAARKRSFSDGKPPYSFPEAQRRVIAAVERTAREIEALPDGACPRDEAVAALVLHPQYLSKSSYPGAFLSEAGLRAVGSRPVVVQPEKWGKSGEPVPTPTSEIFVVGQKKAFENLPSVIESWTEENKGGPDIIRIENFRIVPVEERVKPIHSESQEILLEVVLHAGEEQAKRYILNGFRDYLTSLDIEVDLQNRIDVRDLTFVPVRAAREAIEEVAKFSFLRLAREMPALRLFHPSDKRVATFDFAVNLPDAPAFDPQIQVAIFDGGMPDVPLLSPWVEAVDVPGLDAPEPELLEHGLQVTSAFLFGSLEPDVVAPTPFSRVKHFRVCDVNTLGDMQTSSYAVLKRIEGVLKTSTFDFINLSIGPDQPVEDTDINPWTATLDSLLAEGKTLMTVAVGNSGDGDPVLRYNRIQPPSDCVNAMGIGACDSDTFLWAKADYSSVGCGRSPGLVKPDGVAFGGSSREPFWVIDANDPTRTMPTQGTSFASPSMLRACVGVKAKLDNQMSPLAIRALMVHNCDLNDKDWQQVGWGRFNTDVERLITCEDGTIHVVYQDILEPKKNRRVDVPVPDLPMPGFVFLSATVCFASETDPQDPMHYTRSGLEIFFLPDKLNLNPTGNPKTKPFFKSKSGLPELQLRNNEHKWETTLSVVNRKFQGKSLPNPAFDIHYTPRFAGHEVSRAPHLPYALIVTLRVPKMPRLYDRVWAKYRHQLIQMVPRIEPRIQL